MISIIAALGKNNELGKDNKLIWSLSGDLKFFQSLTKGHKVIMGLKTYYSIGKPLSQRENIILSDKPLLIPETRVYNDIEELTNKEITNNEEIFIIGGASLYKYFIAKADRLYLTHIAEKCLEADVYFPEFNKNEFKIKVLGDNTENGIYYQHVLYERKGNE